MQADDLRAAGAPRRPRAATRRGRLLPHLARAELRIQEALDEARLRALLRVSPRRAERLRAARAAIALVIESPLMRCAPHSARDLGARHAPHLLRVVLEEGAIELVAEAVDEEVLERRLRAGAERAARARSSHRLRRCTAAPRLRERGDAQLQRIVEETAPIEDARQARAHQHDAIRIGGGAACCGPQLELRWPW